MVWNTKDLEKIDPETHVARIGGTVGGRKKETMLEKAKELKIRILNPGVRTISRTLTTRMRKKKS